MARSAPPRPDAPFTLGRLLRLWLPLAFTFLLMSGSNPIVTAGIARLPGSKAGLAAFFDAFRAVLFLHAPTFVVRDIAIRAVRDRRSYVRTFLFVIAVAALCSAVEILVALTPVGDWLLGEVMRTPQNLLAATKRAVLPFAVLPFLITVRGVHQGVHIRGETAVWVGFGTALRMVGIAVFALILAPHAGLEPAVMGAVAFVIGLTVESAVNAASALRRSHVLGVRGDPAEDDGGVGALASFALPLMLANLLGVLYQPLVSRVAGGAGDPETSKAALQVLISWVWFFASTLFALQAMTIAHASSAARLRALVRFGAAVATAFFLVFVTTATVPPARHLVLVTILGIEDADVGSFVTETLPLAALFPVVVLARAILRGLIVRSGQTGWAVLTTVAGLAVLVGLDQAGLLDGRRNGAVPAIQAWLLALGVEGGLSGAALLRIGLRNAFREGRAEGDEPAPEKGAEEGSAVRSPAP